MVEVIDDSPEPDPSLRAPQVDQPSHEIIVLATPILVLLLESVDRQRVLPPAGDVVPLHPPRPPINQEARKE
jgi:hypothetical protein